MKGIIAAGWMLVVPSWALAQCDVPAKVADRVFINTVAENYSPQNPNAGRVVRLELGDSNYRLHILGSGQVVDGVYHYARLAKNVGQLSMREQFGGEITGYTITLVCLTPLAGTFVYTQTQGAIKPDVRQNTGRYTLQEHD